MSFDLRINQGDIALGQDGDFDTVRDLEKLIQDILKILMTPLGSNRFFPWYGSPLTEASVGQVLDRRFVNTIVENIIRSNLETLQKLQKQQAASGQRVTAGELLATIQDIRVHRNIIDPTYWTIIVRVLSKGLKTAEATLDITL
jgi:phage baseplate assembly protein W